MKLALLRQLYVVILRVSLNIICRTTADLDLMSLRTYLHPTELGLAWTRIGHMLCYFLYKGRLASCLCRSFVVSMRVEPFATDLEQYGFGHLYIRTVSIYSWILPCDLL